MTEAPVRRSLPPWTWPVLLVGLLLVAILVEPALPDGLLRVDSPDAAAADGVRDAVAALPDQGLVVVAMDPDLGTYGEIRPAVRAALDALRERGARLAVVSFSVEGRAIAAAEIARLRAAGVPEDSLLDLGFVAGAEAGLVLSVTDLSHPPAGELPAAFAEIGDGIAAADMALVVGGVDIGPRTWVEQVGARVPDLPLVAIVPTFLHPEVAPYLRSGQLSALLGTVRDGAAFAAGGAHAGGVASSTGLIAGLLVALAIIGRAGWPGRQPRAGRPDAEEAG